MSRPIYIFDLDGTLADIRHRLHHINGEVKDWNAFFAACVNDEPIEEVIELLQSLQVTGGLIWIVTGRSDQVLEATRWWLRQWDIHPHKLMMRKAGDKRPDHVIKQEFLENVSQDERRCIRMVFEDRDRVVQMWRDNGLRCLQVAPGEF